MKYSGGNITKRIDRLYDAYYMKINQISRNYGGMGSYFG